MSVVPINAAAAAYLEGIEQPGVPMGVGDSAELQRLLEIKIGVGVVSAQEYEAAERVLKMSRRQIQRKLSTLCEAAGESSQRRIFELSEHHMALIMSNCGNVSMTYRQLQEAGEILPSLATFWRSWFAHPTGVQAFARKGAGAMSDLWIYTPYEAPERNAVWQADHFELPIDVIADGHTTKTVKPWLTVFEDDATRKVMGWALTATPGRRADAEVVRATLGAAIRIRLEHGVEVGGVPHIVRWDNDLSFNAGMVIQLGTMVGFECHAVPPYSGHMKGKVERLGRRIQEQFVMLQPAYTHGPKTYRNKDPMRSSAPISAEVLRGRLGLWFANYDTTMHEGIGTTPMERWGNDTAALRRVDDEKLRSALLVEPRQRKVIKRKGVSFRGQFWVSSQLQDYCNKMVEVRYPIEGNDFIEVYRDGRWLCTAWPAKQLTEDQRVAIWEGRQAQYQEARALQDQAVEIRQGAHAEMGVTDATPSIASMPAKERIEGDLDALFDLLSPEDPE